jgi:hypothetical protein
MRIPNLAPGQAGKLAEVLGQGPAGAQKVLDAIKRGEQVRLPGGLTRSSLEEY